MKYESLTPSIQGALVDLEKALATLHVRTPPPPARTVITPRPRPAPSPFAIIAPRLSFSVYSLRDLDTQRGSIRRTSRSRCRGDAFAILLFLLAVVLLGALAGASLIFLRAESKQTHGSIRSQT